MKTVAGQTAGELLARTRTCLLLPDDEETPLQRLPHSVSARVLYMPAQGVTKVKMGPEEAARKCAPQKAGSPGRRKTGALPRHRAYTSWEDENKENIDPRTRKATATSLAKPKALSSTTADNVRERQLNKLAWLENGRHRLLCGGPQTRGSRAQPG